MTGDWRTKKLRNVDASTQLKHTEELIVSVTLMSLASEVVCTLSSNMCKLV